MGVLVMAVGAAVAETPSATPPAETPQAIMNRACVACHDLGVLTQTGHTAEDWPIILQRMVTNGANVSEAELKQIQDYLVETYSASH